MYEKMQASGLFEFILFLGSSAIWGQSCFLFTLLLAFCQLLSKNWGGWWHLLDHSFQRPHWHLEARNCCWLWHFLLIKMAGDIFISQFCSVTQSCPTLCDPIGYSLPGSSVHGILQAIVLEWIAIKSRLTRASQFLATLMLCQFDLWFHCLF